MNPLAGRGGAGSNIAAVRAAFAYHNILAEAIKAASATDFVEQVRNAKAQGCRTMVAVGGDGTLQLLANEVAGSGVLVGVIPAGSGNDFAAALGIPKNIEKAVAVIAKGNTREVDLACARFATGEQRLYLGGGGTGLDAEAARLASGHFRMWPGRIRYLASAIAALRGFRGVEVQVEFPAGESARINKNVLLAVVLNTPTFGGGLRLAPEARIDDGRVDLVLVEMLSKFDVLTLLPRLLISGELKTQKIWHVKASGVKLSAADEPWFQGDGELLGHAPVEVTAWPGALRIFAP